MALFYQWRVSFIRKDTKPKMKMDFKIRIAQQSDSAELRDLYLKSATKLFSVLLASKRPLITELADKLRLKYLNCAVVQADLRSPLPKMDTAFAE